MKETDIDLPHPPPGGQCAQARLLTEAAQRVRAKGGGVSCGRATEFEPDSPLAMLVNALDDRIATDVRRVTRRLPGDERLVLSAVFPALSKVDDTFDTVPAMDAVGAAASIDLLGYLTQHPPAGRILLALARSPPSRMTRVTWTFSGSTSRARLSLRRL